MLQHLIAFSLKHSPVVLLAAALFMVFTIAKLDEIPVDVFPELNAPTVVILGEAGGLSAEEVELYVTFPVETSVNGIPGVRRVRSGSAISLSIVYVEFDWGTDIFRARQLVTERLSTVEERLPEGVHVELAPPTGITGEIMLLSLSSPAGRTSDLELRGYAESELSNRLLAVPGVAHVVSIGGALPEYQVHLSQDRLMLFDVSMEEVARAAGEAHSTQSAGYLDNAGGLEIPIRQAAAVRSVRDIENTVVKYRDGSAVTIGQIGEVRLGGAPRRGTGSEGGKPAVIVSIQKSPGTNTLAVTRSIDQALDRIEPGLPEGMVLNRHVMRQSSFISLSLSNLMKATRDAAIFVTIVLILFLMEWRTTIITLTALPLSLSASLFLLWIGGFSLNVMTLGGLAVAIGELVDDAIIDVENVYRRLSENAARPAEAREPIAAVVYRASNEIRSPVVFATIIIVMVFVPLLFLQGIEGRFFRPLGIAYITSILASLVVALTVTPALCRHLLGRVTPRHGGSAFVRLLHRRYRIVLRSALAHRKAVLAGAAVLTLASLLLASTFGTEFLPRFNEGTISVFLNTPPGTSLIESDRLARSVERRLTELPGVRSVVRRTGRAERDAHAEPPGRSEIEVVLETDTRRDKVLPLIDEIIREVPGVSSETGQPIEHRLSHVLSGTPAAIAINVFGEDLSVLRTIASEIESVLRATPGTRDVAGNREAMVVSLPIRYRHEDLKRYGLTPASAARQVNRAFFGERVAEIPDGTKRYGLVVRMDPEFRQTVDDVRRFIVRGEGGAYARLSEIADIGPERSPMAIQRENTRRKAVISTNIADGYNLGHMVETIRERVDPIVHRHGYTVQYGGQFEAEQSASRTIYLAGAGVIAVMMLLLYTAFQSLLAALLVMINLPLALVGGIVAVYLTASSGFFVNTAGLLGIGDYRAPVVSIASMVGFVTLFGIAARNGILLVDHYLALEREGRTPAEAIVEGSVERLVPILMTALTAVLGLVPLAWASGEPGSEILAPLAVVVLGGLVTSTVLNLVVVPAGYSLCFDREKR